MQHGDSTQHFQGLCCIETESGNWCKPCDTLVRPLDLLPELIPNELLNQFLHKEFVAGAFAKEASELYRCQTFGLGQMLEASEISLTYLRLRYYTTPPFILQIRQTHGWAFFMSSFPTELSLCPLLNSSKLLTCRYVIRIALLTHLIYIFRLSSGRMSSLSDGPIFLDVSPFQKYDLGQALRIIAGASVATSKSQLFATRLGVCRPSIIDVAEAVLILHSKARSERIISPTHARKERRNEAISDTSRPLG